MYSQSDIDAAIAEGVDTAMKEQAVRGIDPGKGDVVGLSEIADQG